MDMNGCGSTLAASTSEAAQSYPRPSTPCIGGMKTRRYAMRTSTTSLVHPFPLRVTMRSIPISMAEWFSRGWTLQELIAPSNVQFLNKNWKSIGGKRTLAPALVDITGIPEHILNTWTLWKPSMRCSNHVLGVQSDNDARGGQSLFADGSAGREHADAVWKGEKGISPSSAGDHPRIEQPKHLCVGLQHRQWTDWQYSCG